MVQGETSIFYDPDLFDGVEWVKGGKVFDGFCFSSTNGTDCTATVSLDSLVVFTLDDEIEALKAHLVLLKSRMNNALNYLNKSRGL